MMPMDRRFATPPAIKAWRGPRPNARPRTSARPSRPEDTPNSGPAVVALGGGHGLALALQAVRRYAGTITAVVSVADDGGSSGRLRRELGVPAPGDLRKCLVALAGDAGPWPTAFEHRFDAGELADHALGNLLLVALTEELGDLTAALDTAGRLLQTVGRVLPATVEPVVLAADIAGRYVEGQVAIERAAGRVQALHLVPDDPTPCGPALHAIATADQVVLAPGSLYTSVLATVCVPAIRAALADAPGRVIQICNVRTEAETTGLDGTDHLRVVLDRDVRVDAFVFDPHRGLPVDEIAVKEREVLPIAAAVAADDGLGHHPARLASTLSALL
jgi:uncharacterized cofD-like protein